MDDATLLDQLRKSNERALDTLIDAHYRELLNWVMPITGSEDAAEDVLQDLFVRLWDRRETLRIEGPLRVYLYRAARNAALNYARGASNRQRIEMFSEPPEPPMPVDDELDAERIRTLVHNAMLALPPRCREVYVLHREHDLSYPEIAETLGISLSTVKTQMGRAMVALFAKISPIVGRSRRDT